MGIGSVGVSAVTWRGGGKRSRDPSLSLIIALWLLVLCTAQQASAQTKAPSDQAPNSASICLMIESAARANDLPPGFFARVIWQESRFRPEEVGPMTRSGARALGIAQFMPATAAERHLLEPFNPVEALPKSGKFLADLRAEFGNLGLAAAAYNAGPQRVRKFITGSRGLPRETRNYVLAITGRSVDAWTKDGRLELNDGRKDEQYGDDVFSSCQDLEALQKEGSKSVTARLPQRVVPSWCEHLHHPNVSVCGSVHQEARTSRVAVGGLLESSRGGRAYDD